MIQGNFSFLAQYVVADAVSETVLVQETLNDGRVARFGAAALNDHELLTAILGNRATAARLLNHAGSLNRLGGVGETDLMSVPGIGPGKALQVAAALELGRRAVQRKQGQTPVLAQPDAVASFMQPYTAGLEVEKFWALPLNRKNRLIKMVEVTSGTATSTLAHPREVFRAAIRESAASLVVCHSHSSGDPTPSRADVEITHLLREAAKTVEISLADHIIIGRAGADPLGRGYYSFRDAGLM